MQEGQLTHWERPIIVIHSEGYRITPLIEDPLDPSILCSGRPQRMDIDYVLVKLEGDPPPYKLNIFTSPLNSFQR